jgi:phosphatidylinositol alpha-mannosyltransferase
MHSLSKNVNVRFNGNRMSMPLPASRRAIRSLLEREKFDVLHVQIPYSPFLAGRIIIAAPKSTAIVGTFHILPHTSFVESANRALAVVTGRSLKRFDKVLCVSPAAKKFAELVYKIQADVLPNVVDEKLYRAAKPLPQYDDSKLTIMFLGRLVARKGCMTLLEATNILKQRKNLPPFRVVVCGKGPLEAELKQYSESQLLDDVVEFTGFVPEEKKPNFVASSDIMAFPSTGGESFGIVLLEGMAAGRAVVLAGDNPGYRSVLEPRPELLFTPLDAFALANKLTTYLRDPSERQEILSWQRRYISQFDIAVVGQRLLQEYKLACSQAHKKG